MTALAPLDLSPLAAQALGRALHRVDVPRGQDIFTEGQAGDGLVVVEHGLIKITRRGPDGRDCMLAVKGPTDIFGEQSVLDPGPRIDTATALTDARVGWLRQEAFSAWLAANPEAAEALLRLLTRRLRRTHRQVQDLVFTDTPGRVAQALLDLAEQFGIARTDSCVVPHGLTQDELAQLVGASRETVNKVLADFAARGWIIRGLRTVTIVDASGLRGRAA